MRNKFIQVNDNVNKAIAFANTLDLDNIHRVQRIKTPETYVSTMEAIEGLRDNGWRLEGVWEQRDNRTRKISGHGIRLQHPDLMFETNGKLDAIASITLTNSTDGKNPMVATFGAYRQVCSNGLVRYDNASRVTINHKLENQRVLLNNLFNFTTSGREMLQSFAKLKNITLTESQIFDFANKVSKLRWGTDETNHRVQELLRVSRMEDEGNNLWAVMNRIQENATYNINNLDTDIKLNQEITRLADEYALV